MQPYHTAVSYSFIYLRNLHSSLSYIDRAFYGLWVTSGPLTIPNHCSAGNGSNNGGGGRGVAWRGSKGWSRDSSGASTTLHNSSSFSCGPLEKWITPTPGPQPTTRIKNRAMQMVGEHACSHICVSSRHSRSKLHVCEPATYSNRAKHAHACACCSHRTISSPPWAAKSKRLETTAT